MARRDRLSEPSPTALHTAFEAVVIQQPGEVAAVCGTDRITYGELNRRANALAGRLRAIGVTPGALVGIYLERSLEMLVALLGTLKAGGAYVPLETTHPLERIKLMLHDAQPATVITTPEFGEVLPKTSFVYIGRGDETQCSNADVAGYGPKGDHLAYVIYTSGSTGIPKGVEVTHRSILSLLVATRSMFGFGPADVWTAFHSYGFDLSVWEMFGCLLSGGRLVVVPRRVTQSPSHFSELLRAERVSVLSQTPTGLRHLVHAWPRAEGAPPPVRMIVCGGELLPCDLALRILEWKIALWNFYGPTEASVWVTAGRVTAESCQGGTVSVGRPFSNARVYVLDSDLQPSSAGSAGEVCIAGTALARGYLNRPELTGMRFPKARINGHEERIYRTGDLGRHTAHGELEILGRLDQQVKIRGFRVELGEIESLLRQHRGVKDCVVVAAGTIAEDKRLCAYVVYAGGCQPTRGELREFLRDLIPDYMVPTNYIPVDTIPINANGKVARDALPAPDWHSGDCHLAHLDDIESQLAEIWRRLLRVDYVGPKQNFFQLGGESVLAVELFCEIENVFGRYLPLVTLLENQTIEELAAVIRGSQPDSVTSSSLIPVRHQGTETPLFLVHPIGGTILGFKDLVRHLSPLRPLYGLQSRGLNAEGVPFRRVEDMASYYIKQVRNVRATGPYAIAGLCFGAVVAYEMAHQIVQSGESVELLCMLDPDPLDYNPVNPPLFRRLHAKWAVFRRLRSGRRLPYLVTTARNVAAKARRVVDPMRRKTPRPPGEVEVANFEAMRNYQPGVLRSPFVIFRATERPEMDIPVDWHRYSAVGVNVENVPGDHLSMMNEPHVRVIASKLEKYLHNVSA